MRHLIFTNFGIGINDFNWLTYRLAIFELTTVKTLQNQSQQNFTWQILIDQNLPKVFLQKLEKIASTTNFKTFITPVENYSLTGRIIQRIIDRAPNTSAIITTRIDDDDLLHKDAVSDIQKSAAEINTKYGLISFPNGYEFLPEKRKLRDLHKNTIALGLSLYCAPQQNKIPINGFAHHIIEETLTKKGYEFTHKKINYKEGGWLYTKHSLSDSLFNSAKARILKDTNTFDATAEVTNIFGLTEGDLGQLQAIAEEAPNGMPFKNLERFAKIRANELPGYLNKIYSKNATKEKLSTKTKSNQKIRVAILGSCVTRDLFELESDLKEFFEIVFYCARSSVISYCAPPCPLGSLTISGSNFEITRSRYDVEKNHWAILRESEPDLILLDFIDERLGIIEHENTYLSASAPIIEAINKTGKNTEVIRPWNNKLTNLRTWSTNRMIELCLGITSNIIIHKAKWANNRLTLNGNIETYDGSTWENQINLNNAILENVFKTTETHWAPIEHIEVPFDVTIAEGAHKWSPSPFHYDVSYYQSLGKLLKKVIGI